MRTATVPSYSDSMLFCIFMASSTMTTSPTLTASPTLTLSSVMVPGSGALTGEPVPAAMGLSAAGAAAGTTAGRATGLGASMCTFFSVLVGLMGCFSSTSNRMPLTRTLATLPRCPLLLRSLRRNRRLVLYIDTYSCFQIDN